PAAHLLLRGERQRSKPALQLGDDAHLGVEVRIVGSPDHVVVAEMRDDERPLGSSFSAAGKPPPTTWWSRRSKPALKFRRLRAEEDRLALAREFAWSALRDTIGRSRAASPRPSSARRSSRPRSRSSSTIVRCSAAWATTRRDRLLPAP